MWNDYLSRVNRSSCLCYDVMLLYCFGLVFLWLHSILLDGTQYIPIVSRMACRCCTWMLRKYVEADILQRPVLLRERLWTRRGSPSTTSSLQTRFCIKLIKEIISNPCLTWLRKSGEKMLNARVVSTCCWLHVASDCVEIEVILPGTRTTPSLVVRCLSVTSPRPFANDNHHNYTLKPEHNYTLNTTTLWEGIYELFLGEKNDAR